ncbi:MAG: universal stress protein [Deltaproteobacteria bacterium]|nr:universal stress protein [Deltaproteobacteria bacterium]
MEEIKKILAVSWITEYCQATVHAAISLAAKYDAELSVIHVIDTQLLQGWNLPFKFHEEEHKKELERIQSEINSFVNREKKEGMKVKTIIKEGEPVKEILHIVEKEKIDLVVLRAHEESRIEQFMVGSSNDEIIRKMPCSIFLVKGKPKIKTARNNKK